MRYFGSKVSVLEDVYLLVSERVPEGTFCDPFGGVGTVGSYFKSKGYEVCTGDILTLAHYFQISRIQLNRRPQFNRLRSELGLSKTTDIADVINYEKPRVGWITKQFSERRQFFTRENAKRIDGCRMVINRWSKNGWLTSDECALLLASLINSTDRVANTAGTYYAYLKTWYRKAIKPFHFELIPQTKGSLNCRSLLGEAKEIIAQNYFDVLYLDPPYNSRCYNSYYHLPESLALEATPRARGLSGISNNSKVRSDFNNASMASRALSNLLENASFKLLLFHYSDDGLISPQTIKDIFRKHGRVEEVVVLSKGYTTAETSRTIKHRLYMIYNG